MTPTTAATPRQRCPTSVPRSCPTIPGDWRGGIAHGREALRQQIAEWVGTFDGFREEIEEILDLHDRVCVVATQRGQGKGSGVDVENTYALIYEIQDERITALTAYATRAEALEAAGLSE